MSKESEVEEGRKTARALIKVRTQDFISGLVDELTSTYAPGVVKHGVSCEGCRFHKPGQFGTLVHFCVNPNNKVKMYDKFSKPLSMYPKRPAWCKLKEENHGD